MLTSPSIWRDRPDPPQDPVLVKLAPDRGLVVRQFDVSTLNLRVGARYCIEGTGVRSHVVVEGGESGAFVVSFGNKP